MLVTHGIAPANTVVVRVTGVKEPAGEIRVAFCNRSFDEQGCPWGGVEKAVVPTVEVRFADIPTGRYAVAVYQDEDGSGQISTNLLGLPTEPYGFSNEVGRMGPPSFKDAEFDVTGDTTVEVKVQRLFGGS